MIVIKLSSWWADSLFVICLWHIADITILCWWVVCWCRILSSTVACLLMSVKQMQGTCRQLHHCLQTCCCASTHRRTRGCCFMLYSCAVLCCFFFIFLVLCPKAGVVHHSVHFSPHWAVSHWLYLSSNLVTLARSPTWSFTRSTFCNISWVTNCDEEHALSTLFFLMSYDNSCSSLSVVVVYVHCFTEISCICAESCQCIVYRAYCIIPPIHNFT